MCCGSRSGSLGRLLAARSAVKSIELLLHRVESVAPFISGASRQRRRRSLKFSVTALSRLRYDSFALLKRERFFQAVSIGISHIIHAHGGHRLEPRVNFGCTDCKTSARTDADYAYLVAIDKRTCPDSRQRH